MKDKITGLTQLRACVQALYDAVCKVDEDAAAAIQAVADAKQDKLSVYDGVYEITPQAGTSVKLRTGQTCLDRDIIVKEIPYAEISNQSGGYTATIGG